MNKKHKKVLLGFVFMLGLIMPQTTSAHCQIPCGIYDDHARLQFMLEDAVTIEKSITEMINLAGKTDVQSQNQMVRWVMNKEEHAQKIIDIISDYYLTQRVKPSQNDYNERLKLHHAVILAAMKAKQNSDQDSALALKASIEKLSKYYPEHKH